MIGAVLLAIDYFLPQIQLSPLVFVLLILATAFGGMRFGMTYALIAGPTFALAEWHSLGFPIDYGLLLNALVTTVSFALAPVIVVYIQRRSQIAAELRSALDRGEVERKRLVDNENSRHALARAEANYRAVGESIPFGIWQTDADGQLLYVSQSFRDITGMSLEQLQAGGWLELVPKPDAEKFLTKWAERDVGGDVWEGEYKLKGVDGRLYAILSRGVRLKDDHGTTIGWVGVSLDITERKRAIDAITLLEEAGRQMMLSLDPMSTLDRVAGVCVPFFADWCAIDVVGDDGTMRNVVVKHADPQRLGAAFELHSYPVKTGAPLAIQTVARTGKAQLSSTITPDMLNAAAQDERHLWLLREVGLTSAMVVPLIARERVIGTFALVIGESGRRYDAHDLGVAEVLGVRTALAYQNALHYAREVRVADTLQQASLPHDLPHLPGLRINASYVPGASESEIGGDWYDAFHLPDGRIGVTIGDVAGKGLRAAVAMGMVRQALRGAALDGLSPAMALKRVNRHLCHERTGMVTAVTATFDPTSNTLAFASAGHPPLLVASISGAVDWVDASGVPLGLFPEAQFQEGERKLERGDLVVLYTDGLVEYTRDITAGERALADAVLAEVTAESPNPAVSIQHRVIAGQPKDDVAILTLALSPSPIDHLDVEAPAVPASARVMRTALRRLAMGVGLSEDAAFPLLVAAGEAISNAIEHAYGLREGTVRMRGHCAEGQLVIEISDTGEWRRPRDEGRGRGLPLIRKIVDEADVRVADTGTTVRLAVAME